MALTAKADDVHRLTDMVVEEVSAVDRPANRRPFLIVKCEDGAPMKTKPKVVIPDGKGGYISKADDAAEAATGEEATTETTETPETDAAKGVDGEGSDLVLSKAAKETLETAVASALEDLTKAAESVKNATVKDDAADTTLDEALAKKFSGIGAKLVEATKGMHGDAKKPQLHKCSSCKADLSAGAKFCSSCGTKVESKAKAKTKGETETTAKASTKVKVEAAITTLDMFKKLLTAFVGGKSSSSTTVSKSDLPIEAQAILKAAETLRKDRDDQKKRGDTLAAEVLELKKARGDSNAGTVEGREEPVKKAAPYPWPRDMTEPVREDNTDSDTSFFDKKKK